MEDQSSGSLQFRAPKTGEVFKNLNLARVLETLAEKGKSGFYEGWVAEAIVEAVKRFDGVMEKDDLKKHYSTFEDPIMIEYKGSAILPIEIKQWIYVTIILPFCRYKIVGNSTKWTRHSCPRGIKHFEKLQSRGYRSQLSAILTPPYRGIKA